MRIAVLADVHGNIHALKASLAEIKKQKVDKIVLAGDLLNGLPNSKQCLDLLNSQNIILLQGNHERYVFDHYSNKAPESWQGGNWAPVRWVIDSLSKADLAQISNLPMYLEFDNLLITHASPYDDYARIRQDTPEDELRKFFKGFEQKYIVKAHNHVWLERSWADKQLLSIGSNGLAMDGRQKAQFIIAEQTAQAWVFEKFFIDYDLKAALKSFDDSGYTAYTPMALLTKLELITARSQVHPFIVEYARALADNSISLEDAINEYIEKKQMQVNASA